MADENDADACRRCPDVDDRGDVPRDPERFHELVQPRAPRVR